MLLKKLRNYYYQPEQSTLPNGKRIGVVEVVTLLDVIMNDSGIPIEARYKRLDGSIITLPANSQQIMEVCINY